VKKLMLSRKTTPPYPPASLISEDLEPEDGDDIPPKCL
jgi:hypothetical protein